MSGPLGIGVVGAGTISSRVIPHLVQDDVRDVVRVTNVCDPVAGRAQATADAFGIARASLTLDDLLDDPAVDLVTIASPIGLHFEQGLAAVKAGKHVHFNKTMTVTSAEATELIAAAAAADVRIVASPGEVLRPHQRRIKELIAEGAIGRLTWAACGAALGSYHEDEPERQAGGGIDPSWYFRTPGGGPLYDMTVYALHGMTGILGSVRRVTAMSGVRIPEREFAGRAIKTEAHDNTLMLLDFGDNLFAVAYGTASGILTDGKSWDVDGRYYGTAGDIIGLHLNGEPFDYPGRALADSAPTDGHAGTGNEWLLPHITPPHRVLGEQHVYEDVMQLVDWVRDGTPSPVTAEHARHVIEIIEAAYRAADTGHTQELTTTVEGLA